MSSLSPTPVARGLGTFFVDRVLHRIAICVVFASVWFKRIVFELFVCTSVHGNFTTDARNNVRRESFAPSHSVSFFPWNCWFFTSFGNIAVSDFL